MREQGLRTRIKQQNRGQDEDVLEPIRKKPRDAQGACQQEARRDSECRSRSDPREPDSALGQQKRSRISGQRELFEIADLLLQHAPEPPTRPVRLLGVTLSSLRKIGDGPWPEQLMLDFSGSD